MEETKEQGESNDKTWNLIIFKCVGLTYPYYVLQIIKILIVLIMTMLSPRDRWFLVIGYMATLMFYAMNKRRSEGDLEKKILERFPKILESNLRISVQPLIRTKPLIINLIYQVMFVVVSVFIFNYSSENQLTYKDYLGVIPILLFNFMFFFLEYIVTINVQADKIVKPVEIFKIEKTGHKQYSRQDITANFESLAKSINEVTIGEVIINPNFEFNFKTVEMQSVLEGQNSRFQNLGVESIFITGMAVSALFAIINKMNLDEVQSSFYLIVERVRSLNVLNWSSAEFFTLIVSMAAICSIFYLLALIMRIRIGIVSAKAQTDVNHLKFLNEQLETDLSVENEQKLKNKRISLMSDVEKSIKSLKLTYEIISGYRIAGLFTFFSIIIIVSFQINALLGWALLLFAVLSHFLKKLEELLKYINNRYRD